MTGIVNNDHIRELCNNLVLAVEQDVKQRLITRWRQGSKLHKLFRALATRKHGLNIKSLARESGMTEQSVHQAIKQLRRAGYKIVCNRVGLRRPKYKLAS